jgi:hypothetical protein
MIVLGTRESHECCLLPSDTSGASFCTSWQMSREEKDYLPTHLYTASVHGEDSVDWLETSTTSTQQSRCNLLRHSSFWINKISNVRLALGDRWSCPESCSCFWTAGTELHGNGIFKPRQKCISWYGDFVEKWIQFADFTYMWWSAWSWNWYAHDFWWSLRYGVIEWIKLAPHWSLSFYLENGFIVVFCCEHLGQNKQKF